MNGTISIDVATGRVTITASPSTSEEANRLLAIVRHVACLLGDPACFPDLAPKVGPEYALAEAACEWAGSVRDDVPLCPSEVALVEAVRSYKES